MDTVNLSQFVETLHYMRYTCLVTSQNKYYLGTNTKPKEK